MLIERLAWMRNTSSPQYFNLKSWLRLKSLAQVACLVFLKKIEDITINWSLTVKKFNEQIAFKNQYKLREFSIKKSKSSIKIKLKLETNRQTRFRM